MTGAEVLNNALWAPAMVLVVHQMRRKFTADFQARIGPSFAGPRGIFQGFADAGKWISKRGVPGLLGKSVESSLRTGLLLALFGFVLLIPLSDRSHVAGNLASGDLWPLAPLALIFLAAVLALMRGLYQKDPLLRAEALRVAAQMTPALLSGAILVTAVSFRASGFDWKTIVTNQSGSFLSWHAFRDPFSAVGGILFVVTGWVLFHQMPFAPRSSGLRVDLEEEFIRRAFRDFGFYGWSILTVLMFFGGWSIAGFTPEAWLGQAAVIQAKALVLAFLSTWIQASLPGLNQVQSAEFALRVLVPGAFAVLLGLGMWMELFS